MSTSCTERGCPRGANSRAQAPGVPFTTTTAETWFAPRYCFSCSAESAPGCPEYSTSSMGQLPNASGLRVPTYPVGIRNQNPESACHSMLWQADSGFWFRMPTGYVGTRKPLAFGNWPIEDVLYSGQPGADSAEQLKQYLGANHVSAVVVVKGTPGAWARLFAPLGQPRSVQDVDIYTVPGSIL